MRAFLAYFAVLAACAQVSPRAAKLHKDAFVFDGHVHVISRQLYDGTDIGKRLSGGQVDLPRMIDGGLDAAMFTLFVPEQYYPGRHESRQALRLIDLALRQIEANSSRVEVARNAREIRRIHRAGKLAAVLDLEGGFDLDGDLAILRALYRGGLRMAQLPAHNWANAFAESCCAAQSKFSGLTAHGRDVVREMNRLGMVIQVSHASDATIEQVLEVSTQPVLASHHGLRGRNDIPRNMSAELLRKLAAKGGVIGFHIGNEFHNRRMFEWRSAHAGKPFWDTSAIGRKESELSIDEIDRLVAKTFPMIGVPAPDEVLFNPEDWIAVVEEAIAIAGEDHVSLGSDFDGGPTPPRGMKDIADLPRLTEAMLRRGWSEQRIRKFLGGNLLRLFAEVTDRPASGR
ncbi:MAG: dipeptidase [Bryobacterales bacterium]|nr:dipeptidase [Bryobacterales bacterium]